MNNKWLIGLIYFSFNSGNSNADLKINEDEQLAEERNRLGNFEKIFACN